MFNVLEIKWASDFISGRIKTLKLEGPNFDSTRNAVIIGFKTNKMSTLEIHCFCMLNMLSNLTDA